MNEFSREVSGRLEAPVEVCGRTRLVTPLRIIDSLDEVGGCDYDGVALLVS